MSIDFRVADAVDAKLLAKKPRGSFLDCGRVAQRPERVVEREQKRHSLVARSRLGFRFSVFER